MTTSARILPHRPCQTGVGPVSDWCQTPVRHPSGTGPTPNVAHRRARSISDARVPQAVIVRVRSPDFTAIKQRLKRPLVFDGRNLYDPKVVLDAGLEYFSIGRK